MHEYGCINDKQNRYSLSDPLYIPYRRYVHFNVLANFFFAKHIYKTIYFNIVVWFKSAPYCSSVCIGIAVIFKQRFNTSYSVSCVVFCGLTSGVGREQGRGSLFPIFMCRYRN